MEQMTVANLVVGALLLTFNAMYIIGLHKAAQEPYILHRPNIILTNLLLGWKSKFSLINCFKDLLYEGLIGCVDCMASIHSLIFLKIIGFFFGFNILTPNLSVFFMWIIYVCILSCLVDFFDRIKTLINAFIVKFS